VKKIKALKKVEKILQKELEARRQKRVKTNKSSSESEEDTRMAKKKLKRPVNELNVNWII